MKPSLRAVVVVVVVAALLAGRGAILSGGEPPPPTAGPGEVAERTGIPPRNTGPAARAHSRSRRGRHGTTRIIRRTPEVMREDAARVKRGDLFSTWSNEYLE